MRAVQPDASTKGAATSATEWARRAKVSARGPSPRATGTPASPPVATLGVEGDAAEKGHAQLLGQPLAASASKQGVGRAVLAGEVAHVLHHSGHPQVPPSRHVRRSGGHPLRRQWRGGDDEHLGPGQHPGQAHLHVAGPRREVDEQVLDVVPAGVLEKLLDGSVEEEPAPHDGLVLLGQEPHRKHAELPVAHGQRQGDHLAALGLHAASHAQQAWHRKAPDVGVQHSHPVAEAGQGDRQVDRHRGLADASLARGDGENPRRHGHAGLRAPPRACQRALRHDPLAAGCVELAHLDPDRTHPGEGLDPGGHVSLQLGAQRASRDRQGDLDQHIALGSHLCGANHPEVDDVVAELGIDHRAQRLSDGVWRWAPVLSWTVGHLGEPSSGRLASGSRQRIPRQPLASGGILLPPPVAAAAPRRSRCPSR